jgi:DNA-binding transcriptional ArsR family regulator
VTERTNISDPATMRALAHPVRLELLEYLSRHRDGATATEAATVVGLTPSATSYHLRALAKVGMIREAPGRGDGRERRWQPTHEQYSVSAELNASPDTYAAEAAMVEVFLARQNEKIRRFFSRQQVEPPEWFRVATISDQTLVTTAEELAELLARIDALVEPFRRSSRSTPPPEARPVTFQVRGVPYDG